MNNSIIFCGDLVFPFDCEVDYQGIMGVFSGKMGIANLEGAILPDRLTVKNNRWNDKYSLYSAPLVIDILKNLNIKCVSLCNNHILDYEYPIEETRKILSKNGIKSFGLKNPDVIELVLNDKKLFIVTFATFANEHSLPLLKPKEVVRVVSGLKSEYPDSLIALFPHWGIEKFRMPEPADRQLAHQCIDAGADIVVGHHPHVLQDIEIYKGKHIIYSIGNFILPQTYYGEKKLVYKIPYVKNELLVEWDGKEIKLHSLYFEASSNSISLQDDYPLQELYDRFTPPILGKYYRSLSTSVSFCQNWQ